VARTCVSCSNGVLDGLEMDVDCGGDCANKCIIAKCCIDGADCIATYCDTAAKKTDGEFQPLVHVLSPLPTPPMQLHAGERLQNNHSPWSPDH
jgi:hypothetical protein